MPPNLTIQWTRVRPAAPCPRRLLYAAVEAAGTVVLIALIILAVATDAVTWSAVAAVAIPVAAALGWRWGYEHHADKHLTIAIASDIPDGIIGEVVDDPPDACPHEPDPAH